MDGWEGDGVFHVIISSTTCTCDERFLSGLGYLGILGMGMGLDKVSC